VLVGVVPRLHSDVLHDHARLRVRHTATAIAAELGDRMGRVNDRWEYRVGSAQTRDLCDDLQDLGLGWCLDAAEGGYWDADGENSFPKARNPTFWAAAH